MTEAFEAALQSEISNSQGSDSGGEQVATEEMPQGMLDFANNFLNSGPEPEVEEDLTEAPEEPMEEEQDNIGDEEENIEVNDEPDDEEELSDEASPDSVVEYEELKNHKLQFKVGGELIEKTIDQIASELGQVKAASKAQSEVKAERDELLSKRETLEEERDLFVRQQQTAVESQKLTSKAAEIEQYKLALNNARAQGDASAMIQLKDAIDVRMEDYQRTYDQVQSVQRETEQKLVDEQSKRLSDLGYGDLLKDDQRREALSAYVSNNLSTAAVQAINYDATLMAAVEKARLYDAAKSKNGKLKASGKKTLKAGNGKVSTPKKKALTDDHFGSIANRILGTS